MKKILILTFLVSSAGTLGAVSFCRELSGKITTLKKLINVKQSQFEQAVHHGDEQTATSMHTQLDALEASVKSLEDLSKSNRCSF